MAITSVSLSNSVTIQARDTTSNNRTDTVTQGAIELDEQIKNNIKESVDYQIIKKLMPVYEQTSEQKGISANERRPDDQYSFATGNTKTDQLTLTEQALSMTERITFFPITTELVQNKDSKNVQVNRTDQANLSISRSEAVQQSDPLALDLNGDGLHTTGVENGILFDLNGDGIKEQSSFISGGDAFLAYDKNGNGVIDSGKELFGDNNGYIHGFAELSSYDDNHDGRIDQSDSIYDKLKLLSIDDNVQQKLAALSESKIASIQLSYSDHNQALNQYDKIAQLGQFDYKNGQTGIVGDLLLGHKKI